MVFAWGADELHKEVYGGSRTMGTVYSAKDISRTLGLSLRQLDRWHVSGLAPATARTSAAGHRRYTPQDFKRVRYAQLFIGARFKGRILRRAVEAVMQAEDV